MQMWRNDKPTEYGIEVFTEGDCWALAYYISKITGYPIVLTGGVDSWNHVLVKVDDFYLDVLGLHTYTEVKGDWKRMPKPLKRDPDDIYDFVKMIDTYNTNATLEMAFIYGDQRTARRMAQRIIAKYLTPLGY